MKWFLLLFVITSSCLVRAQQTGNELQADCAAAAQREMTIHAGMCIGFLNAFNQLAQMLPSSESLKLLCLPDGATPVQVAKIVVKYLDKHPEKLHLPAAQLVYDATQEAFPCPAKERK